MLDRLRMAGRAAGGMLCRAGPRAAALARVGQHPDTREQPVCVRPLAGPRLDLQKELSERAPNRALCAFVKSVAASPVVRPVGDAHLPSPFAVDAPVSYYGSTGTRGDRETSRPSGSSWSPSSSNTTPLHSRLQPWSG